MVGKHWRRTLRSSAFAFSLEVKINVFFFPLPDEKHKCVWGQQIQLTFGKKIILQKKRRNFLSETMGALALPAKEYYT